MRREALQGALITISLILSIPVLRSMTPEEPPDRSSTPLARSHRLVKKVIEGPDIDPSLKKVGSFTSCRGFPVSDMSGRCGFWKSSGVVEGVMRAGLDVVQAVEGIGAKTADRIRWAVSERTEPYGDNTLFSI